MSTTTNTDQLARECACNVCVVALARDGDDDLNAVTAIIAATLRPVVEERDRLAEINASGAARLRYVIDKNTQLRAEVEQLKAWKESMLAVEREWDEQAVARMLGATPGDSCRRIVNERVPSMIAALDAAEGALKDVIDFCDNARIWHRADQAIALLRELQDVRKAAGPGEPLSGVVATLRDERDALLGALHACFALTGEDAGDLDDFRALQHREQAVIEAVRTLRKNHDEIADRLWKALTP